MISVVVAVSSNNVIGRSGGLPWRLRDDLAYFQKVTMGKPVVMGRKTYESIPVKFRPLPGRRNIVITRNAEWKADGAERVGSLQEALDLLRGEGEVMICGGAEVYGLAMEMADKLYLTEVDAEVDGDVFFPEYDKNSWREVSREKHAEEGLTYDWVVYEK